MSDVETGTPATEGKPLAWNEEAKFQFLLRIVAVLREDNRPIPWARLNMPGRTTKSLQNIWTKINKQIADLEKSQAEGGPSPSKTPTKKTATPRKRTPKSKTTVKDSGSDDGSDVAESTPQSVTPKKRGRPANKSPSKGAKKTKVEDEDTEPALSVKSEPGNNDSDF